MERNKKMGYGMIAVLCIVMLVIVTCFSHSDNENTILMVQGFKDGEVVFQQTSDTMLQQSIVYNGIDVDAVAIGSVIKLVNDGNVAIDDGRVAYRYKISASDYNVTAGIFNIYAPTTYELHFCGGITLPSSEYKDIEFEEGVSEKFYITPAFDLATSGVNEIFLGLDCWGFKEGTSFSPNVIKNRMQVPTQGGITYPVYPFVLDFGSDTNKAWSNNILSVPLPTASTKTYSVYMDVAVIDKNGNVLQTWENKKIATFTLKQSVETPDTYHFALTSYSDDDWWTVS